MWSPGHTSVVFEGVGWLWLVVTVLRRSLERMEMAEVSSTHCSLQGEDSNLLRKCHKSTKCYQATTGQSDFDPEKDALKWMKEWQRSYTDEQLGFWTLLHLLMDGGEMSSQCGTGHRYWIHQHAHQCPRNWALHQRGPQCEWTSKVDRGLCLQIAAFGRSICRPQLDHGGSKHDPQSKLVDTFLAAIGTHVSLHIIREC